jgi:hypothetical protein
MSAALMPMRSKPTPLSDTAGAGAPKHVALKPAATDPDPALSLQLDESRAAITEKDAEVRERRYLKMS